MDWMKVIKEVFGKKHHILLALFTAFLFYSLNIVISSWRVLTEFSSEKGIFGFIESFFFLFIHGSLLGNTVSLMTLIMLSILFGILFTLIWYKIKMNLHVKKTTKTFGAVGIFLAALIPGCVACGVGLLSILGLGFGFLSLLPFGGLEISFLSIVILGFAIVKTSKDMYVCKVAIKK